MTRLDYTTALIATLKGQALRDAFESLAGFDAPLAKGDAAMRKLVLAEIKKRDDKPAKKSRKAKVAPVAAGKKPARAKKVKPVVEVPDYEQRAEDAEDEGRWGDAAALWLHASDATTVKSKKARFAGRAAAAQVRADDKQPAELPAGTETLVHIAEALANVPAVEPEAAPVAETVARAVSVEAAPVVEQSAEVPAPIVEHVAPAPVAPSKPARKVRAPKQPTVAAPAVAEAVVPLTPAFIHDPRMVPFVGQTLSHGPHRLLVHTDGFEVTESPVVASGTRFTSPSAAGMACNKGGRVGGYTYWHVGEQSKTTRVPKKPRPAKPTPDAIGNAWARYIAALAGQPLSGATREQLQHHLALLAGILADKPAEEQPSVQ